MTVNPADLGIDYYFGYLQASSGTEVLARTTVGWAKDVSRYQLKVRGIDRTGAPANTTCCSVVALLNLDTGTLYNGAWSAGTGYFETAGTDPVLPTGAYAVVSDISDWTAGQPYTELLESLADPEFDLTSNCTVTIDARQGKQVQIRTPLPSAQLQQNQADFSGQSYADLSTFWLRTVTVASGQTLSWALSTAGASIYVTPNQPVAVGQLQVGARLAAPALTMAATGHGAPVTLDARYPDGGQAVKPSDGNSAQTSVYGTPPFASPGTYQVADAGGGTPTELAAAHVRGKLALIREVPPGDMYVYSNDVPIDAVLANAASAGAAGVLYAVADPGPPDRTLSQTALIPVAVIPTGRARRWPPPSRPGRSPCTPAARPSARTSTT